MKPLNKDEPGCNYTSTNCVIWNGPDIPCIKLCKGDSISDVVFKLATELCDVLDTLNIDNYDISCLTLTTCAPKNFHDFLQILINIICDLQNCCAAGGGAGSRTVTDTITNGQMPVAPCFYYTNAFGDQVTTMTITDYVTAIGNRLCSVDQRVGSLEVTVAGHTEQITNIQIQIDNLPSPDTSLIIPTCVLPAVPTPPTVVLEALETQFCELRSATGTASEIYAAILKQCTSLGTEQTLGGGGGNMASIPGWDATLLNMAAAINNIWLTLCDARAAIKNIQANCCPSGCDGIFLNLQATLNGSDVVIFVTGTIPPGFANCAALGSLVTITDDNGGSMTTYIDLVTFINNPTGYTVSLVATPINLSSNLHVDIDACLTNSSTNATCKFCLEYTVVNQLNCPVMSYTPGDTFIDYTGTSLPGTNTYDVQLYDSTGTTLISSQVQVITSPTPVAGTFSSLPINTSYRIRVVVSNASGADTTCQFTPVSLLPTAILPLNLAVANSFSVLAGGGITNSTGVGTSTFIGDVGSDPTFTVTGIAPTDVTGILYTAFNATVNAAKTALVNAIADANARTPVVTIADALGGTTINPGVYNTTGGTITLTGNVTFDALGDVNGVFILSAATTMAIAAGATVTLINGASFDNIFWNIGTTATLGAGVTFKGNILAGTDIISGAGNNLEGRFLANTGTVTMDTNTISNI